MYHKAKPYTWICETCKEVFKTKKLLHDHWKEFPEHHIKKTTATHKGEYYCQYCGLFKDQLNTLHLHENICDLNPNKIYIKYPRWKNYEETCNKISLTMKENHKNGKAFSLSQLRRKEKPSYPEQWLMNVIENENIDSNYIREFPFHTFSLDFYWPDKRKVIEIDGRFHKISEYQKDCDKRKDTLLLEEGYEELRIDWEYCFNHSKEIINKIKEFIGE